MRVSKSLRSCDGKDVVRNQGSQESFFMTQMSASPWLGWRQKVLT